MFGYSYAIELLERGTGIRDIRDLLGHQSVATTRGDAQVGGARAGRSCSCVKRLGHKEVLLSPRRQASWDWRKSKETRQRRPVSRVLSPERGGDHLSRAPVTRRLKRPYPRARAGHPIALLFGLAPGGVCRADAVTRAAGELLPHRFTLTALHRRTAVCFLWHCPWGRPPWVLPSTLPCGARTFLSPRCRDQRSPVLLWRSSQYSWRGLTPPVRGALWSVAKAEGQKPCGERPKLKARSLAVSGQS
jgi:hypothetical protein